jgi:hypothetical protein
MRLSRINMGRVNATGSHHIASRPRPRRPRRTSFSLLITTARAKGVSGYIGDGASHLTSSSPGSGE